MNERTDAGAWAAFPGGRHQDHPSNVSTSEYAHARAIARETERILAAGRLKPADINNDSEVLARLTHARVLKPGETLSQFYARVGLGRSQILQMDSEGIRSFCELAAQREVEPPPPFLVEEKPTVLRRIKSVLYGGS